MLEKLPAAVVSCLVALAGVGAAAMWLLDYPLLALGPLIALPLLGLACDFFGRRALLPINTRSAVPWLECWVLVPGAVASLFAGVLIVLAVVWEPSKDASVMEKKLLSAALAAMTTLLTTLFIKNAEDADASWVGAHVRKVFRDCYKRHVKNQAHEPGLVYLREDSPAERFVYSDAYGGLEGWGWHARRIRARNIAERLVTDRIV